jgi:hypothetical protein
MEIYSHVSAAQQRQAAEVLERAIAAESHTEITPARVRVAQSGAGTDLIERESGSSGPEPATYCVPEARARARSRSPARSARASG